MKVLVIEDDFEHMRIVRRGLDEAGFVCDVAKTGADGRDMLANGGYDVAILDRMLPDVDGLDVLREIRGRGILTPVIILSALGSTDERVRGLSAGADDYLPKPFSIDELVARIYAVTRRVSRADDEKLVFKDISLDMKNRVVRRNGRLIDLTGLHTRQGMGLRQRQDERRRGQDIRDQKKAKWPWRRGQDRQQERSWVCASVGCPQLAGPCSRLASRCLSSQW